jgi:hypothetical protein
MIDREREQTSGRREKFYVSRPIEIEYFKF